MIAGCAVMALAIVAGAAKSTSDALPRKLREAVVAQPRTVSCAGEPTIELRLRLHAADRRPTPSVSERFSFQRSAYEIRPGAFVGVARILSPWTDARGQRIPAGNYTLRYVLQPLTKDHFRTTPQRDFLLLLPAAKDESPALRADLDAMTAGSREVSGTGHPAVIALLPGERADADATGGRAGSLQLRLALCGR